MKLRKGELIKVNKGSKCVNDPDPPLIDIVLFGLSFSGVKTHLLGEGFHTLINGGLFSSPTNVGHHNPPTFEAQRPRCHSFLPPINVGLPPNPPPLGPSVLTCTPSCVYPSLRNSEKADTSSMSSSDTICNDLNPPLTDIVLFGLFLSGFPSRL